MHWYGRMCAFSTRKMNSASLALMLAGIKRLEVGSICGGASRAILTDDMDGSSRCTMRSSNF